MDKLITCGQSLNSFRVPSHPQTGQLVILLLQELHTIDVDADMANAAKLLRECNLKRLGVVSNGRLAGVISASDVIAATASLVDVVLEKAAILRYDIGMPRTEAKISGYCDVCEEWSDLLKYTECMFICEECTEQASSTTGLAYEAG